MRTAVFALVFAATVGVASPAAHADSTPAKSTVFGEFLGAGFGIMANYDHRLKRWLSLRGGLGYSFSTGIGEGEYANVVASAHWLKNLSGSHHLELSPGFGALSEIDGDRKGTLVSLLGGYRYQRADGGLFARVQFGAGIFSRTDKDTKTIPLIGLAAGWTL